MSEKKFVIQPDKARARSIERIVNYMRSLPLDKPFEALIGELVREYTDRQRKALFGHAYKIIMEDTGNDKDDLHNHFCGEFFGWRDMTIMGSPNIKPRRTTTKDEDGHRDKISTDEFVKFFDAVVRQAAQFHNIVIPDPNPEWRRNMKIQIEKERAAKQLAKLNSTLNAE